MCIRDSDQTDAQDAAAADSGQDHRQNQRRDGEQRIGDTHDNVAHDALEITGDQAQSRANQRCPEGGQQARNHTDTCTPDNTGQKVKMCIRDSSVPLGEYALLGFPE